MTKRKLVMNATPRFLRTVAANNLLLFKLPNSLPIH